MIVSIGEVLWDIFGDQHHLGGAPFNFAAHLSRLGHSVSFVSAVGVDTLGDRVLEEMGRLGLSSRYITRSKEHATGIVTVSLEADGQPRFVIHRPAAYDFPSLDSDQLQQLSQTKPDWIYFGTLLQMSPVAHQLTDELLDALPSAKRFYDVNLRADSYNAQLLWELMTKATVVKLNDQEVNEISRLSNRASTSLEDFCRESAGEFGWQAVCVTCGARGCVLLLGDQYVEAQGYTIQVADTVGAGDAFAAGFLHGLNKGWAAAEIADFANRMGALVASRKGAIPDWNLDELTRL